MNIDHFIQAMPKVELHVHLEGSIRPETLLTLAQRHQVALPSTTVEGLRSWYNFTDFNHFMQVYRAIASCLRTPEDLELVAREFLAGQAAQNIRYSEVTFTPMNQYRASGLSFADQIAAVNRAQDWAFQEYGVTMGIVIDIPRNVSLDIGMMIADWAIDGMDRGVIAFGLGGPEVNNPPERFKEAFDRTYAAGLPGVPHAGETVGPESIWGSLDSLHAVRIGHGVRCLEDPRLVDRLRVDQIPLEVCPTSNVCLKVFPSFAEHPLLRLIEAGLFVTVNSDDPPLFNTTLTDEYLKIHHLLGIDQSTIELLVINAIKASLLPPTQKKNLEQIFRHELARLKND